MSGGRRFVVVSGPPASGKSTIAPALAYDLGLPLVAKDTIKDALMTALGVVDIAASRQLGRAAVEAMYAVADDSPVGAVLESVFFRSAARERIESLHGAVVEVFCRCPRELLSSRYRARAAGRHAGHFDLQRTPEELWNDEISTPVAGPWPLIEVDTSVMAELGALSRTVRSSLDAAR